MTRLLPFSLLALLLTAAAWGGPEGRNSLDYVVMNGYADHYLPI